MKKSKMENRFKIGDVVCAKVRPSVSLIIQLYTRRVYYCTVQNDPLANELVYFDTELKSCNGLLQIQKT